jgi:hypothetical protein
MFPSKNGQRKKVAASSEHKRRNDDPLEGSIIKQHKKINKAERNGKRKKKVAKTSAMELIVSRCYTCESRDRKE